MAQSKEHSDSIQLSRRNFCAAGLAFLGGLSLASEINSWQAENSAVDALAQNQAIMETPLSQRPHRLTDEELRKESVQITNNLHRATKNKRWFLAGFVASAASIARIYHQEIKELFFGNSLPAPTPGEILASETYSERMALLASIKQIGGRRVSSEEAVVLLCEGTVHHIENVAEVTHPL